MSWRPGTGTEAVCSIWEGHRPIRSSDWVARGQLYMASHSTTLDYMTTVMTGDRPRGAKEQLSRNSQPVALGTGRRPTGRSRHRFYPAGRGTTSEPHRDCRARSQAQPGSRCGSLCLCSHPSSCTRDACSRCFSSVTLRRASTFLTAMARALRVPTSTTSLRLRVMAV